MRYVHLGGRDRDPIDNGEHGKREENGENNEAQMTSRHARSDEN
jgi:hypothetical protein